MKPKRVLCLALALCLALTTFAGTALAEEAEGEAWWQQEYWDLPTLQSLGAEPPHYNAETQQYEISKPEQLLFMSGEWKADDTDGDGMPDAPRDGSYLLINDIDMAPLMKKLGAALSKASGASVSGYMPPISANKENKKTQDDGYFMGVFDGGGHAISNHCVYRDGEYVGLFGYLGYKTSKCYIKNLAVLNITVVGKEDAGALTGGNYATVTNCVITGSVTAEAGAGGLSSSVKAGGGDFFSTIEDCFVGVDVHCSEETGALTGKIAGYVHNCFVAGSVTGEEMKDAGGLAGIYDAGKGVEGCVVAVYSVASTEKSKHMDPFIGSLEGDSGVALKNNYCFDGCLVTGNASEKNPNRAVYRAVSGERILSRALYAEEGVNWDFENMWTWVGSDDEGYPMLKMFAETAPNMLARLKQDLSVTRPVLTGDNPVIHAGDAGTEVTFTAKPVLPKGVSAGGVELVYGTSDKGADLDKAVPMAAADDGTYQAAFPETAEGTYYYYYRLKAGGEEATYPYEYQKPFEYVVSVPVIDATPYQLTVSPCRAVTAMGVNFLTSTDADAGEVRYRAHGETEWKSVETVCYKSFIDEGFEEIMSHSADISDLIPGTEYEYVAVGKAGDQAFESPAYAFTALPGGEKFNVMVISDMQTAEADGYEPFIKTYQSFVNEKLGGADLVLTLGDNVDASYQSAQWENLFSMCQEILANEPSVLLPGNKEYAGDLTYKNYTARTNLPEGYDDALIAEYTGAFIVGDACIVMPSTEVYTDTTDNDQLLLDRAEYYEKQKEWAKELFESSGCKWRVIATHRGPYTVNHNGLVEIPEMAQLCDELDVDLYLNGHDHSYIRASVRNGEKAEPGTGTTYVTVSPMGTKFDDYITGLIDDVVAVRAGSEAEELPKFAMLSFDETGITVTAYQAISDDAFDEYEVIDEFTIDKNLSGAPGRTFEQPAPEESAVPETTAAPAEAPTATEKKTGAAAYVILALCAAAAVILIVRFNTKKKEQKTEAAVEASAPQAVEEAPEKKE